MRKHRKTILLTTDELHRWTEKACKESITVSEFIRRHVKNSLKMESEMESLYLEQLKNTQEDSTDSLP